MISQILASNPWFIKGVLGMLLAFLALILIWGAMKLAGGDVKEFFSYLHKEQKEFSEGLSTVGALNWKCVLVLVLFGLILIAGTDLGDILKFLSKLIGPEKAEQLHESANLLSMFYVLSVVIVLSVLATRKNDKDNRKQ